VARALGLHTCRKHAPGALTCHPSLMRIFNHEPHGGVQSKSSPLEFTSARTLPSPSSISPATSELYPFVFFSLRAHSNDSATCSL